MLSILADREIPWNILHGNHSRVSSGKGKADMYCQVRLGQAKAAPPYYPIKVLYGHFREGGSESMLILLIQGGQNLEKPAYIIILGRLLRISPIQCLVVFGTRSLLEYTK